MAIDLGLDDDYETIKGLSGTDRTWAAKVAAFLRRLYHSDNNIFGPAAVLDAIDPNAGLPVGAIVDWPSASVPDGFVECDGRSLSTATHAALFAVIGKRFGSDGGDTFRVPDFRRRQGIGRSTSLPVGTQTGTETTVMAAANLPVHSHGLGTLAAADAGEHGHSSGGGYGDDADFRMGEGQVYTAAPSPALRRQVSVGAVAQNERGGAVAANELSSSSGAHTHAATEGETSAAGLSENISVVSPSITMVKLIYAGEA